MAGGLALVKGTPRSPPLCLLALAVGPHARLVELLLDPFAFGLSALLVAFLYESGQVRLYGFAAVYVHTFNSFQLGS